MIPVPSDTAVGLKNDLFGFKWEILSLLNVYFYKKVKKLKLDHTK